jgi:hypothetical protein
LVYCDTLGVNFALCREIYPNLGCSVKISIFSLVYVSDYPNFSFTSHQLLFLGTNANSVIILNLSNSSKAHLITRSIDASRAVSDSDFSMLDLCPKINSDPYSQMEYSICRPLNQFFSVSAKYLMSEPNSQPRIDSDFKISRFAFSD